MYENKIFPVYLGKSSYKHEGKIRWFTYRKKPKWYFKDKDIFIEHCKLGRVLGSYSIKKQSKI